MVEPLVAWLAAEERRLPGCRGHADAGLRIGAGGRRGPSPGNSPGSRDVRVLSSAQASWTLTDLSRARPCPSGTAPCASTSQGSTTPGRSLPPPVLARRAGSTAGWLARLRSWFGTLAASRTAEHPVHEQLRADRHTSPRGSARVVGHGRPRGVHRRAGRREMSGSDREIGELKDAERLHSRGTVERAERGA